MTNMPMDSVPTLSMGSPASPAFPLQEGMHVCEREWEELRCWDKLMRTQAQIVKDSVSTAGSEEGHSCSNFEWGNRA